MQGSMRKDQVLVRKQKQEQEESLCQGFYWDLGSANLSNFDRLWGLGAVPSYLIAALVVI